MRKQYVKPSIELELYQLDASIAGNCDTVISYSDGCIPEDSSPWTLRSKPSNVSFGEPPACECYYTGNSGIYWTS